MHPDNSPQRLNPTRISVLYFDPQQDGSTKVRKIRLTEDGEFIDRWPRGFFEERGRELFDE
jgi:predicted ATPase